MKKFFFLLLFCLGCLFSQAQFQDDFGDGNFTTNPVWNGSTADFTISGNKNWLQLKAGTAGNSYLSTSNSVVLQKEFVFLTYLNFTPSGGSYARIYVVSDNQNLKGSLNGYYLQLGTSNANKSIEFFRQDGTTVTKLASGLKNHIRRNMSVRFKVQRDIQGNWQILSDTSGGAIFIPELKVYDNTYTNTAYFGVDCNYAASNSDKFYFDDFVVRGYTADKTPPHIVGAGVKNDSVMTVAFNEAIDSSTTKSKGAFYLQPNNAFPTQITVKKPNVIDLKFANLFNSNIKYTINVSALKDYSGNVINLDTASFYYNINIGSSIAINEIYADTLPSYGLPFAQYVELFNYGNKDINLNNWTLMDKSKAKNVLPNYILKPNDYVILSEFRNVKKFDTLINVIGISKFLYLNLTDEELTLTDSFDRRIDHISYTSTSYNDRQKSKGGYSLERINPSDTCTGDADWSASIDSSGGTPGIINSIFDNSVDVIPPTIQANRLINDSTILIVISEKIDWTSLATTTINIKNLSIKSILVDSITKRTITVNLAQKVVPGTKYTISIFGITDCAGNPMQHVHIGQVIYLNSIKILPGDIILSEIMPKTYAGMALPLHEYFELYNNSGKQLPLRNLTIYNKGNYYPLGDDILDSGEYRLFLNSNNVQDYDTSKLKITGLIQMPSFINSGDTLMLFSDSNKTILDKVFFDPQVQFTSTLKKLGGYSLERKFPIYNCFNLSDWQVSTDALGGTPGKPNSPRSSDTLNNIAQNFKLIYIDAYNLIITPPAGFDDNNIRLDSLVKIENANIAKVYYEDVFKFKIHIRFISPLDSNLIYEFKLKSPEVCGSSQTNIIFTFIFGLPKFPDQNDIFFNEVLYNSKTQGAEYLEIYNNSDYFINALSIFLKGYNNNNELVYTGTITDENHYIKPHQYCAVTRNISGIYSDYFVKIPENLASSNYFPISYLKGGNIKLFSNKGKFLDSLPLNPKWHNPLLSDITGISLEKIGETLSSYNSTNWVSASNTSENGTPGYENSQKTTLNNSSTDYNIPYKVISPDGDGYRDYLSISFKLDKGGYALVATLYQLTGERIGKICDGQILDDTGLYTWQGQSPTGQKLNAGQYLIYFELLDNQGNQKRFKVPIAILYK